MTPIHYRDADAFIVVFSLTDLDSFHAVRDYWIPSIQNYGPINVVVALVGTYPESEMTDNEIFSKISK